MKSNQEEKCVTFFSRRMKPSEGGANDNEQINGLSTAMKPQMMKEP